VEFWGDTHYDQFVFTARQPPFTRTQLKDYFDNNLIVEIDSTNVSNFNLGWEETFYTWYKIEPINGGASGSNQFISAANMPVVYFEEYAEVFGVHKKVVSDYYVSYEALYGENSGTNVNLFRKAIVEDLKYIIESNSILPFTRRGDITLRVGDRRIKKGNWIYFKPTNEIFYVTAVKQSAVTNNKSIDRTTTITVQRGMVRDLAIVSEDDFVLAPSNKMMGKERFDKFSYWNIINMQVIENRLQQLLDNGEMKVNKQSVGEALVNKEVFNFFLTRNQFDEKYKTF
jgi:hypothetical protein